MKSARRAALGIALATLIGALPGTHAQNPNNPKGVDVSELDDNQLAQVRNRYLGFVYQSFNLVKRTSAQANVELPLL